MLPDKAERACSNGIPNYASSYESSSGSGTGSWDQTMVGFFSRTARLCLGGRHGEGSRRQREGSARTLVRARSRFGAGWCQSARSGAGVSGRFPVCNAKDVVRVLRNRGFERIGQKGSHQKWLPRQWWPSDRGQARQQTHPNRDAQEHNRRKWVERGGFPLTWMIVGDVSIQPLQAEIRVGHLLC